MRKVQEYEGMGIWACAFSHFLSHPLKHSQLRVGLFDEHEQKL
jgi:hypothetical protein